MSDEKLKEIAKKHDKFTSVEEMRNKKPEEKTEEKPEEKPKEKKEKKAFFIFKPNDKVSIELINGQTVSGTITRVTRYEICIKEGKSKYETVIMKHAIITAKIKP